MARAVFDGVVVAESDDVTVVEGITYFPLDAVVEGALLDSPTTTRCFWKGKANYFHVDNGEDTSLDSAFIYRNPWGPCEAPGRRASGLLAGASLSRNSGLVLTSDTVPICSANGRKTPVRSRQAHPPPTSTATTADGRFVSLGDYAGTKLALYFYPKDQTPGCTAQACNLRDNDAVLAEHGVAVVGVSPDSLESHATFSEAHDLNFPLIADPDHTVISAYGVWGEKQNYGKTYMGLQRTTFLIDEHGVIQHVFKRPKTKAHAEEIVSKL